MYIARQTFTTSTGKAYRMGDVLLQTEYDQLNVKDKNKVKKKDDIIESSQNVFHNCEDDNRSLLDF